jgi:AmmeMemoRadiSam system protein B
MSVRPPAVAGTFYPDDPAVLAATISSFVTPLTYEGPPPKALIVPHAGYVYSGPTAGYGYAALELVRDLVHKVVLIGPAHRVPVPGLAVPSVDAFVTPLGHVAVDTHGRGVACSFPEVVVDDAPHAREHSLEVHLPFLQRALTNFEVLPLVVGDAPRHVVADVLEALWGGPETLIVVSSDLSHYENYPSAREHDRRTTDAILSCDGDRIGPYDACGAAPVRGLLEVATRRDLSVSLLDLRNSGDTAGSRDRVVGYGAFAVCEP